jgi:hypothetical protein
MGKKTLLAILTLFALCLVVYAVYFVPGPQIEVIGIQTVTGTVTFQPCPLDSTVKVYAIQTADDTIYYIYPNFYIPENAPETKPFLKQNLAKTITVQGEIIKINGQLHIRNPHVVS